LITENRGLSEAKQKLLEKFLKGRAWRESVTKSLIPRRPAGKPIPLSFSQRQVWVHSEMAGDIPIYNDPITVYRKGPLDVAILERCLVEILRRHEILRTTFDNLDGEPIQIVHPVPDRMPFKFNDLRHLNARERDVEASRLASEDARASFDFRRGPLIRARLVRMDEEEYRLYMTIHEIVFDAVSAYRILLPELASIYEAFSAGKPSPLPEPPLQYGDFAYWQQQTFADIAWSDQLSFWSRKLSGELPILPWPNDRARPAYETHRGAVQRFHFDSELTSSLRIFCRREGVSSYMALLAAFVALLNRYTGQEDILIGGAFAGRNLPELDQLIGDFVNPFALRLDLFGNPSFRELTKQAMLVVLDGLANGQVPFTKVVERLQLRTDHSRSPIFQIMLSQQPQLSAEVVGWNVATEEVSNGGSRQDLMIVLDERPDGISGPITYNPDLFDPSTITRMVAHWQTLLAGALANPDAKMSELPLLTDAERAQLLLEWNATQADYPTDTCLQTLIENQVKRTPNAVAVEFDDRHLSYRELNERANQLAHQLQKVGVGPGVLVGLFIKRSLEMVVGLLGILKAGGAYVPMDPDYPMKRLRHILLQSGVSIVLTEDSLAGALPRFDGQLIRLDSDWPAIASQPKGTPAIPVRPEDLAYVLFTSGSTGKPKGVEVPHSALVNFLLSMQQEPGFTAADTLLAVTTLSFDIAGLELFLPLISGGRVVVVSRDDAYDPVRLMGRMRDCQCSVVQATPATWRALIDAGWSGSPNLKLLCGGESLPQGLAQELLPRCSELWNMYGPTETTIWSAIHRVKSANGPIPIGRPIANTRLHILDHNHNLVPSGVVGQLYIGGAGLARGYLDCPELTRESFIPSPFEPDARLYRTGDLARRLRDGSIEFLGRVDSQVKIRGFRIELGEVEAVLGHLEGVRQCVVIVREDTPGEKRLVAYFLPEAGTTPRLSDLRAQLERELPNYMIPSAFVVMEKLPLTPNGKIDRKALPSPEDRYYQGNRDFVAPRDSLEQVLAQLWSKVLKVKHIGLHDNFFELGGHSLLAVRLLIEIEKLYKKRFPLATLIQSPTIGDLADILRQENWKPSWSSLVPLRAGGSNPPLFLMHAHGGNVLEYHPLANRMDPDQPVYALQARGLDGRIPKKQSLKEMVGAYLNELRSLQPEGPYYLGGFCFGGLLALEAAHQLRAAGEEVALLVIIQTMHPASARFKPGTTFYQRWWYLASKRFALELENISSHGGQRYILERSRRAWDIARARAEILFDNVMGNGDCIRKQPSMPYILESLTIEHDKARLDYQPRPYSGNVLLLRASKQLTGLVADQYLGWKNVFHGNLDLCEVPGHQQNMLSEPNVLRLAKELENRLLAAQERPEMMAHSD